MLSISDHVPIFGSLERTASLPLTILPSVNCANNSLGTFKLPGVYPKKAKVSGERLVPENIALSCPGVKVVYAYPVSPGVACPGP